eukprot:gene6528-7559_t
MDLFSHLNWYDGVNGEGIPLSAVPKGKFVVITDTLEAEGSFVLHHLLQAMSKRSDTCTTLLALNQSLFHYHSVGRKLGYNLTTEHNRGTFSFINALSAPYPWVAAMHAAQLEADGIEEDPPLDPISKGFAPFPVAHIDTKTHSNFASFLHTIYKAFIVEHEQRVVKNPQARSLFIIDNINLLASFAPTGAASTSNLSLDILSFLQCLHTYVKQNQNCSVIVLFHSDSNDDETFFKQLQYEADLTMNIAGLPSGYSKDIDGQIDFLQKNEDNTMNRLSPIHYQVLDNTIRFFSMGSRIQ